MGRAERANAGRAFTGLIRPDGQPARQGQLIPVGRVLLGYPVGQMETTAFSASVRRLVSWESMKDPKERVLAGTTVAPGLYVDDNRNALAKRALDIPTVDWLWQVDTDIEFKPDFLDRMLAIAESRGLKILAASVPIGETWPTCGYRLSGRAGEWKPVQPQELGSEPIEVDGIATACTLIHRDALVAIAQKHGRRWFDRIAVQSSPEGTPLAETDYVNEGEDFSFCLRARDVGLSVWCVYVPGIRHWKIAAYTHDPPEEWPRQVRGPGSEGVGNGSDQPGR